MPGFRKGKAPPSLVIQRLGFGAGAARRRSARRCPSGTNGRCSTPASARSATPASRWSRPPRPRASRSSFKFEVGVRPPAKLGEYKGLEVGKAENEVADEIVDTEVERIREGFARLEPVEREAAEGDSLLIDFEGLIDGNAFEGGKAEDYLLALGSGSADRGLRGAAGRRQGRRGARGRGHLPRRLPGRAPGRRRRGLQRQGQRGAGEDPARARRRLRLRRLRVRHPGGAARRHPRESRRGARQPRRGRLPHRRRRRRRRRRDGRGARRPGHRPRRPNAGSGWNASSPSAAWTPTPSCRCRAKPARS